MSLVCSIILQMLVGTYGRQIYKIEMDSVTYDMLGCDTVAVDNASYVAFSPEGKYFYAISESGPDSKISSFENKAPYRMLSQVTGVRMDPCFVMCRQVPSAAGGQASRSGRRTYLLTGDYSGGSVSVFPTHDGVIEPASQVVEFHCSGPNPVRQPSSHIHQLKTFGRYLFASDLGGDRIHVLSIFEDADELKLDSLFDVRTDPGAAPRHMEISADGSRLYLLTELSREIYVYSLEYGDGLEFTGGLKMTLLQKLFIGDDDATVIADHPLEEGVNTQSGGDIHLYPSGKVLYASLRNGADKIAIFDVAADGTLTRKGSFHTALHPRNFALLDEYTMIVPCKNSDLIQIFSIDSRTGLLSDTGRTISLVCPVLTVSE